MLLWVERGKDGAKRAHVRHRGPSQRERVTDFYRRGMGALPTPVIAELPLDARGTVPVVAGRAQGPTLHTLLVHTTQETARHAGTRTSSGKPSTAPPACAPGTSNLPSEADADAWKRRHDRAGGASLPRTGRDSSPRADPGCTAWLHTQVAAA